MALPPNISLFVGSLESSVYENEVVVLFAAFARFEYAMKRTIYVKAGTNQACEPDWTSFENAKKDAYEGIELEGLPQARDYFNTKPPRKQVYTEGKMKWKAARRNGQSDLAWHSQSVKRVRNNLFHGEKTSAFMQIGAKLPEQEEPSRNIMLIRHSLVMLEAFLECDNELKQNFHDFIPGTPI